MKRFTNHPEPWGDFIDVKMWPEIKNPGKYAGKEAFLESVTDCYQPCEAKYKHTIIPINVPKYPDKNLYKLQRLI